MISLAFFPPLESVAFSFLFFFSFFFSPSFCTCYNMSVMPKESDASLHGSVERQVGCNKALDVNDLIVESELDVLCLTETWPTEA